MAVALIGECMVELSQEPDGRYSAAYGGDTLNTAVYLARLGVNTNYITVIGSDALSDQMLAGWASEGIGTSRVLRSPGQLPGLYLINRTAAGERSFMYWRQSAPVRDLFDMPDAGAILDGLQAHEWLYLSGITLSLFAQRHLQAFLAFLDRARAQGCRIAFDGNYRPQGWPDRALARHAFTETLRRTTLALPTLEDETALFGDADVNACAARLQALGVEEIVIKRGPLACVIISGAGRQDIPASPGLQPVDTTAAGDSFNAGYLAARMAGQPPAEAAIQGHRLAGVVIMHRGAIIPRQAMPDLNKQREPMT